MGFTRVRVVPVVLIALVGSALFASSFPAQAAVTTSTITAPFDGTHYMITDASPPSTVTVTGTTNGTTGDLVDIRCYEVGSITWQLAAFNVAVQADGSFSASMSTGDPYGSCRLRAVPHNLPAGSSIAAYAGPVVTTEYIKSYQVSSGPNAGKTYDYYVAYQSSNALNDYESATSNGLWDSRLTYPDGGSSHYLWYANAILDGSGDGRSRLQVDGRNAYGPPSARARFQDNPGLPQLTFSVSRNGTTGVTTIRETSPIVVCPAGAPFPPTGPTCPQFNSAGVRLERTIVTNDGGRQVHITDVWRSTDGKPHTISAHYYQEVQASEGPAGSQVDTLVGLKLPWLGGFQTFTGDATYPGPAKLANTILVRDSNTAPDGDTALPRGAITFDFPLGQIHRTFNDTFTMNGASFTVAAGGVRVVRQSFVMGTTDAEVAAKAAANAVRLNPYRTDALIKKLGASTYVGNGIYNTTGAGQAVTARTKRTRTATFLITVQNDGTQPTSFRIKGAGGKTGFGVQYFKGAAGTQPITFAVTRGTYLLSNVAPGQSRVFRLAVTVKPGATIGALRSWLVLATSTNDATRKDAVKANVRVRS